MTISKVFSSYSVFLDRDIELPAKRVRVADPKEMAWESKRELFPWEISESGNMPWGFLPEPLKEQKKKEDITSTRQAWEGHLLEVVRFKRPADNISGRISIFVNELLQAMYAEGAERESFFETFVNLRSRCFQAFTQVVQWMEPDIKQKLLEELFEGYPIGTEGKTVKDLFNDLGVFSSLFSISLEDIQKIDHGLYRAPFDLDSTRQISLNNTVPEEQLDQVAASLNKTEEEEFKPFHGGIFPPCPTPTSWQHKTSYVELGELCNGSRSFKQIVETAVKQFIDALRGHDKKRHGKHFKSFIQNRTECMKILRKTFPQKTEMNMESMVCRYFIQFPIGTKGETFGGFLEGLGLSLNIFGYAVHHTLVNATVLSCILSSFELHETFVSTDPALRID